MIRDLPEVLSVEMMAQLAGDHPGSVRRKCANGTIPAVKVGRKWLIARDLVFRKFIDLEEQLEH